MTNKNSSSSDENITAAVVGTFVLMIVVLLILKLYRWVTEGVSSWWMETKQELADAMSQMGELFELLILSVGGAMALIILVSLLFRLKFWLKRVGS